MADIFLKLVNMGSAASWLIIAVLILRLLLKKAPKSFNCFLWCMVGVRLLIPLSVESVFSLIPSVEVVPAEVFYSIDPTAVAPAVNKETGFANQVIPSALTEPLPPNISNNVNRLQMVTYVVADVWFLGVLLLLTYTFVTYVRLRHRISDAVRWKDNIFQSEKVSSPFVLGMINPRIYITYTLAGEQQECVIAHEKAHIRRRDHWLKPIGFMILAIYWFHPLVWVAYIFLCRDIELACDERVLQQIGMEKKRVYSETLLNCSANHKMIAACPIAFGEVGVKNRIKGILNYRKPTLWVVLMAFAACGLCIVCFMTNPEEGEGEEKVMQPSELVVSSEENLEENAATDVVTETEEYETLQTVTIFAHVKEIMADKKGYMLISSDTNSFPGAFLVKVPEGVYDISPQIYDERYLQGGEYIVITMWDTGEEYADGKIPIYEALFVEKKENFIRGMAIEEVNSRQGVTVNMECYNATDGDVKFSNTTNKELTYGDDYRIQMQLDGVWYDLQPKTEMCYHDIGYALPPKGSSVWKVNWEAWYGGLPKGQYRIVKSVIESDGMGTYQEDYLAAEFEIME